MVLPSILGCPDSFGCVRFPGLERLPSGPLKEARGYSVGEGTPGMAHKPGGSTRSMCNPERGSGSHHLSQPERSVSFKEKLEIQMGWTQMGLCMDPTAA